MSDETNDGGFLDHLFNALGHLGRVQRKSAPESTEGRKHKGKKFKSFDEAPPTATGADCCIAKRE